MRVSKGARWALVIVAAAALVFAAAAAARTHTTAAKSPIIIGWAHDSTGAMAPFDGPALAAAQLEVNKVNKKGARRPQGRDQDLRHAGRRLAAAKACADQLISQGRERSSSRRVTSNSPPRSSRSRRSTSACSRSRRASAPTRWGRSSLLRSKGKLAFSFGNVAQDEGSAMAQVAWNKRLEDRRPREGQDDHLLRGRRQRLQGALQAARRQDQVRDDVPGSCAPSRLGQLPRGCRGIDAHPREGDRHGDRRRVRRARSVHRRPADGERQHAGAQLLGRRRRLLVRSPKITNYWFVTYANAFGHDPSKAVNTLANAMNPASRDGRVHHRAGRDRRPRPGDQAGARLARRLEARGA